MDSLGGRQVKMASADNVVLNVFVYMILTVTFRGFREEILPASLDNIPDYDAGRSFRNSAAYPYFQDRLRHSTQCTLDSSHCLSVVSNWRAPPVLFYLRPVFLWNGNSSLPPFRPRPTRPVCLLLLLLLTSGDIEVNPGPTENVVVFGCYNVRSAVNKAASLHDIINDHGLNILALSETWITDDAPPAIAQDIAPNGFGVIHTHRRRSAAGHVRGGGLALIFNNKFFTAQPVKLKSPMIISTFEHQLIKITSGRKSFLVVNIYRPSSSPLTELFFDQLADMLSSLAATTTDHLLICGDFNCPGTDQSTVDHRLVDILETFGLDQHVKEATRGDNVLDVVATHPSIVVSNVRVDEAGMVSDHRLVIATLQLPVAPVVPAVPITSRRINGIDLEEFQTALRQSSLFTNPSETADGFAQQICDVVTQELDRVAPLKTSRRRPSKPITKFLSLAAKSAKRERRRLERTWKSTKLESDRVAYRRSCRTANRLINESRMNFMRDQLADSTDSKQRWQSVKNMLHSNSSEKTLSTD